MAVMTMRRVIAAVNDKTEIKIYKDGTLLAKGNWFQDQILEYVAEKMVEADLDGACNKCKVTILR
ncbi:hypothetical protein [Jingyaoa shaoxingensis]|uniref:Uncharacterized protein n=1 Tax=Jingyaoa shaoxingensis TaxID=2763671 RepID=A0ABR7ND66_9FIRM|nr:hypothetical protein [Jingyaoa shaoxingensis]MBC8573643.1 hypothetical protein [Jingyaoa shaoxingensis]